jgi:hypothetical protein
MKDFDYNDYNNLAKALDEYFASVGYDCEKVWEIHEELSEIYEQMLEGEKVNEESALETIDSFVQHAIVIKDAFFYPISMQECLQALILIGMYPVKMQLVLCVPQKKLYRIVQVIWKTLRMP